MTVGVLLITHDGIGDAILDIACSVFGTAPLASRALSVPRDADTDACFQAALSTAHSLDSGDGVLVLSDLFGSTPSNVAVRVCEATHGTLVSGVSLPMLLRVFNYPKFPLEELAVKAVEGGHAGVVRWPEEQP